jgi:hypothetical protein
MLYKLFGMLVWNGGKVLLRQRYGRAYVPKPVLAGAAVAVAGGVALAVVAARRNGSGD